MAGGLVKYRHLSRGSAHRQALLRNLVTSLIIKESIHTTYAKAKEAQRLAEKLITLAKKNTVFSQRKAQGILYTPHLLLPKLFGPIRERYADRAGGYTRVLRTEPKDPIDQGASAILELVDGKRDIRFHMTAATIARDRQTGSPHNELTLLNMKKVTQGRKDGKEEFENLVALFEDMKVSLWATDGYMPPELEIEGGPDEDDEGGEEYEEYEEGDEEGEGEENDFGVEVMDDMDLERADDRQAASRAESRPQRVHGGAKGIEEKSREVERGGPPKRAKGNQWTRSENEEPKRVERETRTEGMDDFALMQDKKEDSFDIKPKSKSKAKIKRKPKAERQTSKSKPKPSRGGDEFSTIFESSQGNRRKGGKQGRASF